MAARGSLDVSDAAMVAAVDPTQSALPAAIASTEGAAGLTLHDACWTPGESCRLAYRSHTGAAGTSFLAISVTRHGWSQRDFREDPALPTLGRATASTPVAATLAEVLGSRVHDVRIEPVRYRVGTRCVLHYKASTSAGEQSVFAKVLPPDAFANLAAMTAALDRIPDWRALGSPLLGISPEVGAVLTAGAPGLPASRLLGDAAAPVATRARLAHQLGRLLAGLHSLSGVAAPRWSAEAQIAALRASVTALVTVDALLGERVLEAIDRLAARPPAPVADSLIHGGFRPGQVVVGKSEQLTLLDVDGIRHGDRCRDLGTALAHLLWRSARRVHPDPSLPRLEEALLTGYQQGAAPHSSLESLDWWRVVGLLQLAVRRYSRLETWDWPTVPVLVAAAAKLLDSWEERPRSSLALDLLDVPAMSRFLAPLIADQPTLAGRAEIASAHRLAVAEGRRVVVSYSVGSAADGPTTTLIGKAFTDLTRAELLDRHLRILHGGPLGDGEWRVPEPLGIVVDKCMTVFRGADGTPLSAVTDLVAAEAGVRRASCWLARLHTSGATLPRRLSLDHEGEVALEWSDCIGAHHPGLGDRAERLAVAWLDAARQHPVNQQVPLHKDFHAGHVIIGDDVCVIDLDEARLGDPAFDVAHFLTYLEATRRRRDQERLRDAFLESYAEASGWTDQGSLAPYCAYTWLKIAKQHAMRSGPFAELPQTRRSSVVKAAIDKGTRCLER